MITLKLFNAVLAKDSKGDKPYVSEHGFIIEPGAIWAKDQILLFYEQERLSGNELNKTFHKSWKKIMESSRLDLLIDQIRHYLSTYGSNFKDEVYIPDEVLEVPDVKLKFKVIKALSKDELTKRCLDILKSGIALKEETIRDLLALLHDELDYQFTGKEGIRNKEAVVQLADLYGVYPDNPTEFLRFVMYKTIGSTLLIKDGKTISEIANANYNPTVIFKQYGLERLAEIFNRFKPIFLAYKNRAPKTINRISKLSKRLHKPMVENPLGQVTIKKLTDEKLLEKATTFALLKALSVCDSRLKSQDAFLYRIRNGKSWAKEADSVDKRKQFDVCGYNYNYILTYLRKRMDWSDKKIYIPKDVEYALPTSEKMFVGNIPTGTKFIGDKMAVGVYWRDDWGANDLDLSGLFADGSKVGWDASYNMKDKLFYSGDKTSAPNGATEYLYAHKELSEPVIVMNNVYSGDVNCDYKIIVGRGDNIDYNYMMNPNKLFVEAKCQSVQRQSVLGLFLQENKKQTFVVLNFGAGHMQVSKDNEYGIIARKALIQQWTNPLSLSRFAILMGAKLVDDVEKANVDLSLDELEKDTFTKLFE